MFTVYVMLPVELFSIFQCFFFNIVTWQLSSLGNSLWECMTTSLWIERFQKICGNKVDFQGCLALFNALLLQLEKVLLFLENLILTYFIFPFSRFQKEIQHSLTVLVTFPCQLKHTVLFTENVIIILCKNILICFLYYKSN